MNDLSSKCVETAAVPPDPRKHVNYVQGMVLGADDLHQEFAYHQYQNHWLARDALGYGTLSGLLVEKNGTQIAVTPGTALSPRGQLIRVAPRQCASLDAWLRLADTQQRLHERGVGLNDTFAAYVVLCFHDCPTDPLPIPGEPCRCDNSATSPSRITDDFRLELRMDPPAQREEDAVRDFVAWLRRIRTAGADSGHASVPEFLEALRAAARDLASPLESPPDFMYGSPPENLVLPRGQLCEYLRAALHLWVTELRPIWQARWATKIGGGCGCHGEPQSDGQSSEPCLLLAKLKVTLSLGNATEGGIEVDDRQRPLVVHLRMLQELLLCGRTAAGCNGRTFATLFLVDSETLRLWVHHPVPVNFDESALFLEVDGRPLAGYSVAHVDTSAEPDPTYEHNVFDVFLGASPLVPLADGQRIVARFDTRLIFENSSPVRSLAEALHHGCACYSDLADDVLTVFHVALQSADNLVLAGDVTGPVHSNTVDQIKSIPVSLIGLMDKTALAYDAGQWHPVALPQASDATPLVDTNPGLPGTSDDYSRADHVHPLPPLPQASNATPRVDADPGLPGTSDDYSRADHVHPLPPLPQASDATPLVDADPGFPGTSDDYSRADHVHPLPPMSQPSTSFPRAVGFGQGQVIGTDPRYSPADHVHDFVDPVPPHVGRTTDHLNHEIHRDVEGTLGSSTVTALQHVPVSSTPLAGTEDGFVLTFRIPGGVAPGQWQAERGASGQASLANTGRVRFKDVSPGQWRKSNNIKHGFETKFEQICIRLGFELGLDPEKPSVYSEDTDSIVPDPVQKLELILPSVMAHYVPGAEDFFILLRDRRPFAEKPSLNWQVRWWAIPAQPFGEDLPDAGDSQEVPEELFAAQLLDRVRLAGPTGETIVNLAKDLGVDRTVVESIAAQLGNNTLRRVGSRLFLPN